jgi:hypothetical protein
MKSRVNDLCEIITLAIISGLWPLGVPVRVRTGE